MNNVTRKQKTGERDSNVGSNNRLSQMKLDNRQQCNSAHSNTLSRPSGSQVNAWKQEISMGQMEHVHIASY